MTYYHLNARLLAPMMIQKNRQSNASGVLPYLPGSTLRGAIAGACLRNGEPPESTRFRTVFLDRPVCFPDLLPSKDPDRPGRPLPMSAASCKRYPGFSQEKGHGVHDILAAFAASELEGCPVSAAFTCQSCPHDIEPFQGFWNGDLANPQHNKPVLVYHRHTGIDRHTGTAASSSFYFTQGISETWKGSDDRYHPQYLSNGLYLDDDQFDILSGWLTEPIFAGANRTRGMGEITLALTETRPPAFDLEAWNDGFVKKLSAWTSKPPQPGVFFSIELASHTILVDKFLRPSLSFMPNFPDTAIDMRMIRPHTVRGWQNSWQLPKPEDTAIAMGGVYLCRYTGDDLDGLKRYLNQLMAEGVGLRRPEGFGRVIVCDPFHIQEVI